MNMRISLKSFHSEHKNCFLLPNRIVEYFNKVWYLIEFNISPNEIRIPILEVYENRKHTYYLSKNIGF
jgi:hypothetical protein